MSSMWLSSLLRSVVAACAVSGMLMASGAAVQAADKPDAVTDPAKADADFALQGEYSGTIKHDDKEGKLGVQVVALGDGMFLAAGYMGGLPGDGWDKSERKVAEGKLENGAVVFTKGGLTATLKDGKLTFTDEGGNTLGTAEKVQRKSPTLGAKPPENAVVLFDGTSPEKFKGGRMTEDGLLMQGLTSHELYQGFTLHVEFMTPYMPKARGQGRGNSGFYAQGRYEVQILDSFGLSGENNECGGIYTVKSPDQNMCFPPLSWQTYDIDFTPAVFDAEGKKTANARMTVKHNGVVIHDNVEVPNETRASPLKEGPAPGPIYFQDHGNPVRFKNIWLAPKS